MTCQVSVVIPTRGRPQLLSRCLAALATQDLPRDRYEIIVVDDGKDGRSCLPNPALRGIRYLNSGGRGPAAARNLGWREAGGRIIAFTDDDCIPSGGWLRAGLSAFVDGVAGASGPVIVPRRTPETDYERDAAQLERSRFVTANCFYRRDVLAEVGGFDERFPQAWREDTDLYFTLLEQGARFEQVPDAVVTHPVREAPFAVSLRQQRKASFNALLYRKHPELYRKHLAMPARHYATAVGALVGSLTALVWGRRGMAACTFGIWLGITCRFCARRLRGTSHAPRHLLEMAVTSVLIPPFALFWRVWGALKYRVCFL